MPLPVARAVVELKESEEKTYHTKFRMADFAEFALRVAPVVGREAIQMSALIDQVTNQQVAFAIEDERLVSLIDDWLHDETHTNIHREISVTNLGREISRLAGGRIRSTACFSDDNVFAAAIDYEIRRPGMKEFERLVSRLLDTLRTWDGSRQTFTEKMTTDSIPSRWSV